MSAFVTTTVPQLFCKGQSFRVYMEKDYVDTILPYIKVNDPIELSTLDNVVNGYVHSVDYFGNSFLVTPITSLLTSTGKPTMLPTYIYVGVDVYITNLN